MAAADRAAATADRRGAGDAGGHAGPDVWVADPVLTAGRDGQIIIADKNYYGHGFEATLADDRICLLRPARKGEPQRAGTPRSSGRCARSSWRMTTEPFA